MGSYKSHREERKLMCKEPKEAVQHYTEAPTVLGSVHLGLSHDSLTSHVHLDKLLNHFSILSTAKSE